MGNQLKIAATWALIAGAILALMIRYDPYFHTGPRFLLDVAELVALAFCGGRIGKAVALSRYEAQK